MEANKKPSKNKVELKSDVEESNGLDLPYVKDHRNKGQPKVLVGCPTFSGMSYCLDDFMQRIKSLSYPDYDIIMVDNTSDNTNYFTKLANLGVIVKHLKSAKSATEKLVESRNMIISYMLEHSYSHLLMMDQDVIPPKDIIERLLTHKKDIVSGLYYNYFDTPNGIRKNPVAFQFITPEEFSRMQKINPWPEGITHKDVNRKLWDEEIDKGELLQVKVPSAGCMMISRKALEEGIRYSTLYGTPQYRGIDDDINFCKSAREKGYKLYLDPTVKCEHLVKGKYQKDGKGNYIHPLG